MSEPAKLRCPLCRGDVVEDEIAEFPAAFWKPRIRCRRGCMELVHPRLTTARKRWLRLMERTQ